MTQSEVTLYGRKYTIQAPQPFDLTHKYPVILAFHGGAQTPQGFIDMSELGEGVDKHGYIAVYPEGIGQSWNAGLCCGYARDKKVDDIAFIKLVIKDLVEKHNADPAKIYATGISNGACFCYRLAIEAPELLAAIAPVAGTVAYLDKKPSKRIPIIHFHGTADKNMPILGGFGTQGIEKIDWVPARKAMEMFSLVNDTKLGFTITMSSYTIYQYTDTVNNYVMSFFEMKDGGHTWPGGNQFPTIPAKSTLGKIVDVPVNSIMWEFFKANVRQ